MAKKVVNAQAGRREPATRVESQLPEEVTVALTELAAKKVTAGVDCGHRSAADVHMMQEDVTDLCGPKRSACAGPGRRPA